MPNNSDHIKHTHYTLYTHPPKTKTESDRVSRGWRMTQTNSKIALKYVTTKWKRKTFSRGKRKSQAFKMYMLCSIKHVKLNVSFSKWHRIWIWTQSDFNDKLRILNLPRAVYTFNIDVWMPSYCGMSKLIWVSGLCIHQQSRWNGVLFRHTKHYKLVPF